jgi:hypothetical protein
MSYASLTSLDTQGLNGEISGTERLGFHFHPCLQSGAMSRHRSIMLTPSKIGA